MTYKLRAHGYKIYSHDPIKGAYVGYKIMMRGSRIFESHYRVERKKERTFIGHAINL